MIWEIAEYFTFVRGGLKRRPPTPTRLVILRSIWAEPCGGVGYGWMLRPRSAAAGSAGRHDLSAPGNQRNERPAATRQGSPLRPRP